MAKEWAKGFYDSVAWKRCRDNYIATRVMIDGGMCEECHERLGYIVHHKTNLTKENISDQYISLNPNNLAYVCKPCHDREEGHFIGSRPELLCAFDENGQPISLREIDLKPRVPTG